MISSIVSLSGLAVVPTYITGTSPSIVARPPPPPGQDGSPGLLAVQGRLGHPVVWPDVDEVQVGELLGEVVEGHPELALVPDPDREELLVSLREGVPLPGPLAPGPVPLSPAPGVPQSDEVSVAQLSSHPGQARHTVGVSRHQAVPQPHLPLVRLVHLVHVDAGYQEGGSRHGAVENLQTEEMIFMLSGSVAHNQLKDGANGSYFLVERN